MRKLSLAERLGPRLAAAIIKHRDDPTMLSGPVPGDTLVENTLPLQEARRQWHRLGALGIFCTSVDTDDRGTRVVYSVPSGVGLV